ncbi:MAG: hypothetical protein KDA21_04285 [Phycisphaerales bacterium]|nr:hypothetical protein [Phycisphaerales bacterium]
MIGVAVAVSLILNMAWLGMVRARADWPVLAVALGCAALHALLLVNMLTDFAPAPMAVDAAALAWHGVVLPATLVMGIGGAWVRRRRRRATA